MIITGLRTAEKSLREDLNDPELRKEWERAALARVVAIEVIRYRAEHGISQTESPWKSWRLRRFEGIMESCQITRVKRGIHLK